MYAFAPTAGQAFNAALVSHEATTCIGTMIDTAAVAEPCRLHAAIADGLDAVLDAADRTPVRRGPAPPVERDHRPERLTSLDSAFLRIETPSFPMHIGGVMELDGGPLRDGDGALRIDAIRDHVEARLARAPRFLAVSRRSRSGRVARCGSTTPTSTSHIT